MRQLLFIFILFITTTKVNAQEIDHAKLKEDLDGMISVLSQYYAYFQEKEVAIDCIKEYYGKQVEKVKTREESVLLFEYLLDEFYDSHLILNTNTNSSYRLYAPIYASIKNNKAVITSVWMTQLENLDQPIIGATITKINGIALAKAINEFPTHCSDKEQKANREWIINKILAGRYNEPRVVTLQLSNGKTTQLDLDQLKLKQESKLVTTNLIDGIGVIRINNSLGNDELVKAFDQALNSLSNSKGLVIDLRNTVDGGDSYEARGILGRFISKPMPYQRHLTVEKPADNPAVERNWMEFASPRGEQYKQPVVVLVGRWTGSMGEGLAIGFEGIERGVVVGTEMERLAGEMTGVPFSNRNFGYRISIAKLFHVNGTPREQYRPTRFVNQTSINKDEILEKGINIVEGLIK